MMIGFPWLAVTFAGKNIRKFWFLPFIVVVLFLAGTWMFFDMGEPAFVLFCGCYLVIGVAVMLISSCLSKRKQ